MPGSAHDQVENHYYRSLARSLTKGPGIMPNVPSGQSTTGTGNLVVAQDGLGRGGPSCRMPYIFPFEGPAARLHGPSLHLLWLEDTNGGDVLVLFAGELQMWAQKRVLSVSG